MNVKKTKWALLCLALVAFVLVCPKVANAEVKSGQTVCADKVWTIKFNKQVKLDDLTRKSILMFDSKSNNVDVSIKVDEKDNKCLKIEPPKAGYVDGDTYTLRLLKGVTSVDNKNLKKEIQFVFKIDDINKYEKQMMDAYENINHEKVIEICNKVLEVYPDNYDFTVEKGQAYMFLKEYDKAIECENKAIDIEPDDAFAYGILGEIYLNQDKNQEAIENFNIAINKCGDDDKYNSGNYLGRGCAYRNLGENDKAIEDFKKALELDPENEDAKEALEEIDGESLDIEECQKQLDDAWANSDYEEIIEICNRVLAVYPNKYGFTSDKGQAYMHLEKYDKAIEWEKKAIDINPDEAWAYKILGEIYLNQDKNQEAIENFNIAINKCDNDEDNSGNYLGRGCAYKNLVKRIKPLKILKRHWN